jgi:hypothetical protein
MTSLYEHLQVNDTVDLEEEQLDYKTLQNNKRWLDITNMSKQSG